MTQEELDFLHCHEPDFLRKVRHAFVQQRLADYPDHYREWFIDELSDTDRVAISVGLRGVGIGDVLISKAVYNREQVLSCLHHKRKTINKVVSELDIFELRGDGGDTSKARLLDELKIPVYELRKPLPLAVPAIPAIREGMPFSKIEGGRPATPATPATPAGPVGPLAGPVGPT